LHAVWGGIDDEETAVGIGDDADLRGRVFGGHAETGHDGCGKTGAVGILDPVEGELERFGLEAFLTGLLTEAERLLDGGLPLEVLLGKDEKDLPIPFIEEALGLNDAGKELVPAGSGLQAEVDRAGDLFPKQDVDPSAFGEGAEKDGNLDFTDEGEVIDGNGGKGRRCRPRGGGVIVRGLGKEKGLLIGKGHGEEPSCFRLLAPFFGGLIGLAVGGC